MISPMNAKSIPDPKEGGPKRPPQDACRRREEASFALMRAHALERWQAEVFRGLVLPVVHNGGYPEKQNALWKQRGTEESARLAGTQWTVDERDGVVEDRRHQDQ